MSAAATAAGYLYASGRLRGRAGREHEGRETDQPEQKSAPQAPRVERVHKEVRVAALPSREDNRPKRQPTIQYRTRRWRPSE